MTISLLTLHGVTATALATSTGEAAAALLAALGPDITVTGHLGARGWDGSLASRPWTTHTSDRAWDGGLTDRRVHATTARRRWEGTT